MTEYRVRAVRWEHGWELHLDADRVTQSRTLGEAERVVRDYLVADGEPGATVVIDPELDERTRGEIDQVRRALNEAQRIQTDATTRYRGLIGGLKGRGLSSADIARVLKISPGRVSQLIKHRPPVA